MKGIMRLNGQLSTDASHLGYYFFCFVVCLAMRKGKECKPTKAIRLAANWQTVFMLCGHCRFTAMPSFWLSYPWAILSSVIRTHSGSFCLYFDCCFPTRCLCNYTFIYSLCHVSRPVSEWLSLSLLVSTRTSAPDWCWSLLARMSVNWPPLPTFASFASFSESEWVTFGGSATVVVSHRHRQLSSILSLCMDMANLLAHKVVRAMPSNGLPASEHSQENGQLSSKWTATAPIAGHWCSFAAVASGRQVSLLATGKTTLTTHTHIANTHTNCLSIKSKSISQGNLI